MLLQQLATRLQRILRESDTVARLGGDEFGLLLPATSAIGATCAADKLLMALAEPFVLEGHRFMAAAGVGIAVYPQHGGDVTTLLRRADIAMYDAKRAGGRYALYTSAEVVAEGVETPQIRDLLAGRGCDMAQRYGVSRPLPAADLTRWLHETGGAWSVLCSSWVLGCVHRCI